MKGLAHWLKYVFKRKTGIGKRKRNDRAFVDEAVLCCEAGGGDACINDIVRKFRAGDLKLYPKELAALLFFCNRAELFRELVEGADYTDIEWTHAIQLVKRNPRNAYRLLSRDARARYERDIWSRMNFVENWSTRHDISIVTFPGIADEINDTFVYGTLDRLAAERGLRISILCDVRLHALLSRTYENLSFVPAKRYFHKVNSLAEGLRLASVNCALPSPKICNVMDGNAFRHFAGQDAVTDIFGIRYDLWDDRRVVFLKDDAQRTKEFDALIPKGKRVGLIWKGLIDAPVRRMSYIRDADVKKIIEESRATFVNLQYDQDITGHDNVVNPAIDRMNDFDSLLSILKNLDFLVSPLTATARLAAAAGVKVIWLSYGPLARYDFGEDGQDLFHDNVIHVHGDNAADADAATRRVIEMINA